MPIFDWPIFRCHSGEWRSRGRAGRSRRQLILGSSEEPFHLALAIEVLAGEEPAGPAEVAAELFGFHEAEHLGAKGSGVVGYCEQAVLVVPDVIAHRAGVGADDRQLVKHRLGPDIAEALADAWENEGVEERVEIVNVALLAGEDDILLEAEIGCELAERCLVLAATDEHDGGAADRGIAREAGQCLDQQRLALAPGEEADAAED